MINLPFSFSLEKGLIPGVSLVLETAIASLLTILLVYLMVKSNEKKESPYISGVAFLLSIPLGLFWGFRLAPFFNFSGVLVYLSMVSFMLMFALLALVASGNAEHKVMVDGFPEPVLTTKAKVLMVPYVWFGGFHGIFFFNRVLGYNIYIVGIIAVPLLILTSYLTITEGSGEK